MAIEDDFVLEEEVRFEIDGKEFGYRPITGGDALDISDQTTIVLDDGTIKQDAKKLAELKLLRITKVPYTKEDIQKVLGIANEYKDLTNDQKLVFFRKMKSTLLSKIITKLTEIDEGRDDQKKN